MRISDWSSDVCSSDLLHFDNLADRLRLVGCAFIMGLRDAVADPIAKIARPPVDTLPVIEPARPDRLGVLFGKKGRLQFGLAPLRSEEHTSELRSLMRLSYAVFSFRKTTL